MRFKDLSRQHSAVAGTVTPGPDATGIRKRRLEVSGLLAFAAAIIAGISCTSVREDPLVPVSTAREGGASGSGAVGGSGAGDAASGDAPARGGAAGSGAGGSLGSADAPPVTGMDGPACIVGSTRCAASGPAVEVCTLDGQWVMDKACPSICSNGACAGMCTPEDSQCGSNGTPEKCNAQGEWVPQPQPCEFVCTGKGECTGECKPNLTRCGDAPNTLTPYRCDEKGKWVAQATCTNVCLNGSCGGSCPPGKIRCSGNRKEVCGPMGTWDPAETCPFVCTGEGTCTGECVPNSKRCDGQTPQICDAGKWTSSAACSGKTCLNGACVGSCAPGDRQCSNNTPQTCDAGNWKSAAPCSGKTCVDGMCTGVCAPPDKQCGANNTPQTCSGGSWRDGARCNGTTCVNGACAGTCEPGDTQCGNANNIQTCEGGAWKNGATCTGKTCMGGACMGVCAPTDKTCSGNTPQSCVNGAWRDGAACNGKTCFNGTCTGECEKGAKRCNAGTTPQTCSDRGMYTGNTPCPGGFACDPQGGCPGTTCAKGEKCGSTCQVCEYGCGGTQCRAKAEGNWTYTDDFAMPGKTFHASITQGKDGSVRVCYTDFGFCGDGRFISHNQFQMPPEFDSAVGTVNGNTINWSNGGKWSRS